MLKPFAAARDAAGMILDFALPPRCPGCGAVTTADHRFCFDCWQTLRFLGDPCCARCGLPFEHEVEEGAVCGACLADPPPYDRMRTAVAYGDVARRVAVKLKYQGRPGVAATLAHFMSRHVTDEDAGAILAPVPLHRERIWKRGYNQSALIASALAKRTGLAVELALLERRRATPPLEGLGRRERALAVKGAFRISDHMKALVRGRAVILVDDVLTTGATAGGCAKVLARAGAARVTVLCWARVVRGGD